MTVPFDISAQDLTQLYTPSHHHVLVYQDKKGQLFLDQGEGIIAGITRWVTHLVGVRDYRIHHIVKNIESRPEVRENDLASKNLTFLCGKMAKGFGIDEQTFGKIIQAEKLLHHELLPPADLTTVEQFFLDLSKSSSLQKKIGSFQAKLLTDSPEVKDLALVLDRAQMTSRWTELGLDVKMLNNDYQGASFLIKSRLIYSIVGYQNSTVEGPKKHEIKVDETGHMLILKEGEYVQATELAKEFFFDKKWQELARKENPEEHWNYLSPDGLVPVDRWLHPDFLPIETLSHDEVKQLVAHAETFYPEGQAPRSDTPRDCVVQIFTNPRKSVPLGDTAVAARLDASFPVHVAIRVITSDGLVYSTGFGSTIDEDKFTEKAMLATINGMPTILDYEEFRKHEGRIVTSIPVTQEATDEILSTLQSYRDKTIRFNLVRQNCARLATDVLDKTGAKVDNTVNGREFLLGVLPSTRAVPVLGDVTRFYVNQTTKIRGQLPEVAQQVLNVGREMRLFIPRKMASIFCNVFVLALGGSSGSPLPGNRDEAATLLKNTEGLQEFGAVIENPLDMISKDLQLSHSLPIIQWQLRQRSTVVHPYGTKPCMGILPCDPSPEQAARTKHFKKKFLTNFGL